MYVINEFISRKIEDLNYVKDVCDEHKENGCSVCFKTALVILGYRGLLHVQWDENKNIDYTLTEQGRKEFERFVCGCGC